MEEESQPTPLKIANSGVRMHTMHRLLEEIDDKIIQFTNSSNDTPSLDLLAQHIQNKLGFIRNLLSAEIASNGTRPHDLEEFEGRLTELEADFYKANLNLRPVNVHDGSGDGESGSGSVCESCFNNDHVDVRNVDEAPEMLHEVVVPSPEVCFESTSDPEKVEMTECKRRCWTTVAILTTVSAGLMVSFSDYLFSNRYEDFLTPT